MYKETINIFKTTSWYSIGEIFTRGITFFLLPFFTAYLSTSDYGYLEICNNTVLLLSFFFMLGIHSSYPKVFTNKEDKGYQLRVKNNAISFYLIYSIFLMLLLVVFNSFFSKKLLNQSTTYLFNILVVLAFLEGFLNLFRSHIRIINKHKFVILGSIIRTLIYLAFAIYFVKYRDRSFVGIKEATLISLTVLFLIYGILAFKKFKISFDKEIIKELLLIGFPIAIAGLASWVINLTDRYMLKELLPESIALSKVGVYGYGAKLASILKIGFVNPFMLAWSTLIYRYKNKKSGKNIFANTFVAYCYLALIIILLFSMVSTFLIEIVAQNQGYYEASRIVIILALSHILFGIYTIFTVGLVITKKTKYIAFNDIVAAIINVVLNYFLIPNYGILGAAGASLISFIFRVSILYYLSQKFYKINFTFKKIFLYTLFILTIVFTNVYIDINIFVSMLLSFSALLFIFILNKNQLLRTIQILRSNR